VARNDEITALKEQVAALTAKVSALEAHLAPKPPPEADLQIVPLEGQTLYSGRPLKPRQGFLMPSEKELDQLCSLVRKRYPRLNSLQGLINPNDPIDSELVDFKGDIRVGEYLRQMRLSFIALSYLRRTPGPDYKRYISHWQEEAEIILGTMDRRSETLRFAPFACAVIMHGDILYTSLYLDGQPLSLGLDKWTGTEAKDGWKRVLSHGVLEPVGPVSFAPGRHDQSQVRITQGI
jgi:hypothetical protein